MSVVNTSQAKKWDATMKSLQRNAYLISAVLFTIGLSYFLSLIHI